MKKSIKLMTLTTSFLAFALFVQAQAPIKPEADGTLSGGTLTLKNCTSEKVPEGLKITFLADGGKWCIAAFIGPFDLTGYSAIEMKITNVGTVASKVSVRADNPGPISDKLWNMGVAYNPVEPGESTTLRIDFGYDNFRSQQASYPLDPSKISQIMLTTAKPNIAGITFRIDSIKAVK